MVWNAGSVPWFPIHIPKWTWTYPQIQQNNDHLQQIFSPFFPAISIVFRIQESKGNRRVFQLSCQTSLFKVCHNWLHSWSLKVWICRILVLNVSKNCRVSESSNLHQRMAALSDSSACGATAVRCKSLGWLRIFVQSCVRSCEVYTQRTPLGYTVRGISQFYLWPTELRWIDIVKTNNWTTDSISRSQCFARSQLRNLGVYLLQLNMRWLLCVLPPPRLLY